MRKHYFAKILTLVLTCTMVFAGMAVTAAETGTDAPTNYFSNEGFDTYTFDEENTTSLKSIGGMRLINGWTINPTGGVDSSPCLESTSISSANCYTNDITGLTPGDVLELTADVQAPDGKQVYLQVAVSKDSTLIYTAQTNTYTGNAENASKWTKLGTRVVLAEGANKVKITFRGTNQASGVKVDNVKLVDAGDNNILINGDFEQKNPLDATKPFGWGASNGAIDNTEVSSGNCIKIDAGKSITLSNIYSAVGAVYRLSFKYKPGESGGSPKVYLDQEANTAGFSINPTATAGQWTTVTAYLTSLTNRVANAAFYVKANTKSGYFDDISLELIEEPMTVDCFATSPSASVVGTASGHYSVYAKGDTLSTLPSSATSVYAYVNMWDASLLLSEAESSTKTVLLGVYKTNGTKKQLCEVAIDDLTSATKTGTSTNTSNITYTNGTAVIPGTSIIPLSIPEETGTYTIEAYVWDSISGLSPFASKTVVISGAKTTAEEA